MMASLFQANKFGKINNLLTIPDTIPEQSAEFSLKSEVSKLAESLVPDNNTLQLSKSDESSNASTIIPFDNSFLLDCERKLLECSSSSSDDDKTSLANNKQPGTFHKILSRKLGFDNSISTPPNELRQQINFLRDEISECHEFHDMEIQVLRETLEEGNPEHYSKLIEQYSVLLDLYTSLKKEYELYRNEQEKFKDEIHSKTADCLENLCSQIEASDSSLNFSDTSLISFTTPGVKCSTMMENMTEGEITILNNTNLTIHDPLAITNDNLFKTPRRTPFKNCKKMLPLDSKLTSIKSSTKGNINIKDLQSKEDLKNQRKSGNMKLVELQMNLSDKMREIKQLEDRLFKVEDLSSILEHEFERRITLYIKENSELKSNLSTVNMQVQELTQKLITETIALNPILGDSLASKPAVNILSIFIDTIMESCKGIQNELITKVHAKGSETDIPKTFNNAEYKNVSVQYDVLEVSCKSQKSEITNTSQSQKIDVENNENGNTNVSDKLQNDIKIMLQTIMELENKLMEDGRLKKMCNMLKHYLNENNLQKVTYGDTSNDKLDELLPELCIEQKEEQELNSNNAIKSLESNMTAEFENIRHLMGNLKQKIEATDNLISKLKDDIVEKKNETEKLKQEKECDINLIEKLREEIKTLNANVNSFTTEMNGTENYKEKYELIKQQMDDDKNLISNLNSKIKSLESQRDELLGNLHNAANLESELRLEVDKIRGEKLEISTKCKNLEQTINQLQIEMESKEKILKQLTDSQSSLEKIRDDTEKFLSERDTDIRVLESQLLTKETERNETLKKCQELENNMLALSSKIQEKEDMLKQLTDSQLSLQADRERLQKCSVERDEEFSSLQLRKNEIERELLEAQETIQKLQLELLSKEIERDEAVKKCQELENGMSVLSLEMQSKEDTMKNITDSQLSLDEDRENMQKYIIESDAEIRALQLRKNEVAQDFVSSQENIQKLESQLLAKENELEESVKRCQELENEMLALTSEITAKEETLKEFENLKCENNELRQISKEFNETIDNLQCKLQLTNEKLEEHDKITEEIKLLKEKNHEFRKTFEIFQENRKDFTNVYSNPNFINNADSNVFVTSDKINSALKSCFNDSESGMFMSLVNETIMDCCKSLHQELKEDIVRKEVLSVNDQINEIRQLLLIRNDEIRNLEDERNKLIGDLQNAANIETELRTEIEKISDDKLKLSNKYECLEQSMHQLQAEMKSKEEALKQLTQSLSSLEEIKTDRDNLRECIADRDANICLLELRKSEIEGELLSAQEKVQWLESQLVVKETELEDSIKRYQELENERLTLISEITAKEEALKEYENLKCENNELQQISKESKEMVDNLQNKLQIMNEKLDEHEKVNHEIKFLKEENNEFRKTFEIFQENRKDFTNFYSDPNFINNTESNVFVTSDKVNSGLKSCFNNTESGMFLSLVNETIMDCCKSLRNELEAMFVSEKSEALADRDLLLKKIEDINKLESERNNLIDKLQNATSIENELRSEVEKISNEKTDIRNTCDHLKQTINDLQVELQSKEETLKQLTESQLLMEDIKNYKENLEKCISERDAEISSLQLQKEEVQRDLLSAQETIQTLELELIRKKTEGDEAAKIYQQLDSKIFALSQEIEANNERLTNFEDCALKLEYEKLLAESLRTKLKESDDLFTKLNEEIVESKNEIEKLKHEKEDDINLIENLREEVRSLNINVNNSTDEINEIQIYKGKYEEIKQQVDDHKELISKLDSEIKTLESVREELVGNLHRAENVERELRLEVDNICSEKLEISNKCGHLEQTINQLQVEMESKEEMLKQLSEYQLSLEKMKLDRDDLKKCISERDEEIRIVELQKIEIQQSLFSAQDTIQNLESQLLTRETERDEIERKCRELESEILALSSEMNSKEGTLEQLIEAQLSLEKMKLDKDDLVNCISDRDADIRVLELKKNQIEGELLTAQEEIQKLESKLLTKETMLTENLNKCKELENEMLTLTLEITKKEEILKDLETLKYEYQKIVQISKESSETVDDLQSKLQVMNVKLEKHEKVTEELKQENNEFKKTFEVFREHKNEFVNVYSDPQFSLTGEPNIFIMSDKINSALKSCFNSSESGLFMSAVNETIMDCCKSLHEELKKDFDYEWKKLESIKEQTESLKEENNRFKDKVAEFSKEVEKLVKEKEEYLELSEKVKALEDQKIHLVEVLTDIRSFLNMPTDVIKKLLDGNLKNTKIFVESLTEFADAAVQNLNMENTNLKMNNEALKDKVQELSMMVNELSNQKPQQDNPNGSFSGSKVHKSSTKSRDLCTRRLDKLEEINHNLTELITRILTNTKYSDLHKLKFSSIRDYPNITKKVSEHFDDLNSKLKTLEEANVTLDEECESYANTIKELQKEAASVWKSNKEKFDTLESVVNELKKEKTDLELEKTEMRAKISKLDEECRKLKQTSNTEGTTAMCNCRNELKKVHELKRTILMREQKILELQDMETQNSQYKSQIKYLENALEQEKKKIKQEKEKIKKLQGELDELSKNQKCDKKGSGETDMLDELRMRGSVTSGVVQEFVDKEKMRKLSKDIAILKELCRARYSEIKRLEAENASLKSGPLKNLNQMDSPLCAKSYNTRSKNAGKYGRKTVDVEGKENLV
ncbi:hypothetical protein RUM44_001202 [Polyplax serrata]|uniref:Uncharacterized protein n=1 Tax=Polyplax serrata TaxID=468196 RepID=A0ABR1B6T7_POLSC